MTIKTSRKDVRKLFDDKEQLLREQPGLRQAYSGFLRDWEQYKKTQEGSKKAEKSRQYSVFGASFRE